MADHSKTEAFSTVGLKIPQHVAIIMDGNGRWAQLRGRPRNMGHREGAKRIEEMVVECQALGIKYLTLYAFSTENWGRPQEEVTLLMRLLIEQLKIFERMFKKNKVSLRAQGMLTRLPKYVQKELQRVVDATALENPKGYLTLCLSYGGRQEILESVKAIARKVKAGKLEVDDIDEMTIRNHLHEPTLPDPDLLIRTAGEYRVSNFLLWQIAYTEFWITPTLWPDFKADKLHEGVLEYNRRQRRFGMTSEQISALLENPPQAIS